MQGEFPYWGANSIVDRVNRWLFDEDLVLLGEDGAPFFDRFKPVAFHVNGKIWVNNHAHVLRPRNRLAAGFLAPALNCVDYRAFIDGSTRDKLTQGDMNRIPIQSPPLPEQRAIATFLDRETAKIDALIEKKERLIELLQEKRTALITHAVTKGLDPGVTMKDSGVEWLGEVPAHWEIKPLRHVLSGGLRNGIFKKNEHFGKGVKLVNVIDVYVDNFYVHFDGLGRVEADEKESLTYAVKPGDIFFVRSSLKLGGVARAVCIRETPESTVFECHLVRGRPNRSSVSPDYLIHYLNNTLVRQRLISASITTTMSTISQPQLASLEVLRPPPAEQRVIAAHLQLKTAGIDSLVKKIQGGIGQLKEYRTALISAAVTGKIDVREEVA